LEGHLVLAQMWMIPILYSSFRVQKGGVSLTDLDSHLFLDTAFNLAFRIYTGIMPYLHMTRSD
jgi:hypothetical protein